MAYEIYDLFALGFIFALVVFVYIRVVRSITEDGVKIGFLYKNTKIISRSLGLALGGSIVLIAIAAFFFIAFVVYIRI